MQPDQSPLLYDRLGDVHNVAAVLEDLIDRFMSGPRLNSNPAVDEAHHRVCSSGFTHLVTEMVCEAAGGSTPDGRW
jgi:hemoglobin